MKFLIGLAVLTACVVSASASGWTISTFAGTGQQGTDGDGGPATSARVNDPYGLVRGPDGAIWFCEHAGNTIRRVDKDGTIHTVAGTGKSGYTGDGGPAKDATFNLPHELRFDAAGNLFVADMANQVIRRIDAKTGIITTVAGTGKKGYAGDGGAATAATLNSPHSLQFGPDGALYICDVGNHVIRRVDPATGIITTVAGVGKPGPTPDGAPISGTPINAPRSIDFDAEGNLWLATREGSQVFKLELKKGVIHLVAGTGETGFAGNGGPAKAAKLSGPKGIAIDRAGDVWLADTESHSIRRIDVKTGTIDVVAGTGSKGDGPDGDPLRCAMNRPHGVFVDADGTVFIGDSEAHRVRVLRRN